MKGNPSKAFILAAGFGTRMAPITSSIPKPLLPVWQIPLIERTIRMLSDWGVSDITVNIHHDAGAILTHFRNTPHAGIRINLAFENPILGTGGALRRASWFLDHDPFWLVNGDIIANVSPKPFLQMWQRSKLLSAVWLTDRSGPRTVELEGNIIKTFRSNRPGTKGTFTMCGVHLLSCRIVDYIDEGETCSLVTAYERGISAGERIAAVNPPNALWLDVGTPEGYLDAHEQLWQWRRNPPAPHLEVPASALRARRKFTRAGLKIRGFLCAEQSIRTDGGAVAENSVILGGVTLASSAKIIKAVVAPGAVVKGLATRLVFSANAAPDHRIRAAVSALGWPAKHTLATPLPPRGSARTFVRLSYGYKKAMLICYSIERPENAFYATHAQWLNAARLPVPRVLVDRPREQFCVMEDVGDRSLQDAAREMTADQINAIYKEVLRITVQWHNSIFECQPPPGICEPFSQALFKWEHDLFIEKLLVQRLGAPSLIVRKARRALQKIISTLMTQPQVLLHRDLQSSNIHIQNGKICFIDFQGMRMGPSLYDVASLLADPYVSLPPDTQDSLLETYARVSGNTDQNLQRLFWTAAVQRLAQALGAYGRLAARPETARFQFHIVPALIMLDRAARQLDDLDNLREVATWALEREKRLHQTGVPLR